MSKNMNSILLIDDNEDDNFFHQKVIESMNMPVQVTVALDGEEALTYLKQGNHTPPDLIVLDLNMPRMNGFEFLKEYQSLSPALKTKVLIMLTTSISPVDRKKAEQISEVIGFENKPLSKEMLTAILEKYF
ncbi:MAG TPA: response regulator [Cytophagaceae bacterium]|jgi:CheY-like chemotaxis protein|nr:response regulator [Cytophagaceae bacterium]